MNLGVIFEEVNWRNEAVNVGNLRGVWRTHYDHIKAFSGVMLLHKPFSYIQKLISPLETVKYCISQTKFSLIKLLNLCGEKRMLTVLFLEFIGKLENFMIKS